jgi:hypothetical protein
MGENEFTGSLIALFLTVCISIPLLILYIWSVLWAYNDANKRGRSGCLVALLVLLLTWPVGLIIWLIFRPEDVVGAKHDGKFIDDGSV